MVHEDELTAGQEMVEDSSCLLCLEQNLHGNRWEQGWVNSRQLLNYNGTSIKGPSKTGTTSLQGTLISNPMLIVYYLTSEMGSLTP